MPQIRDSSQCSIVKPTTTNALLMRHGGKPSRPRSRAGVSSPRLLIHADRATELLSPESFRAILRDRIIRLIQLPTDSQSVSVCRRSCGRTARVHLASARRLRCHSVRTSASATRVSSFSATRTWLIFAVVVPPKSVFETFVGGAAELSDHRISRSGEENRDRASQASWALFQPRRETVNYYKTRTYSGGEGGIRTHGTVTRTLDFESSPFGHSGTSPPRSLAAHVGERQRRFAIQSRDAVGCQRASTAATIAATLEMAFLHEPPRRAADDAYAELGRRGVVISTACPGF